MREDPSTIFLLEDAGKEYPDFCQIATFTKNIIRPEYLNKYLYFYPYTGTTGKFNGDETKVRLSMEDRDKNPAYNYVAVIDTEIEFRVTSSALRKLSKEHMPAWGLKSYLNFFGNNPSGVLLLLRVYKVNQFLDFSYAEKGSKGSFQVFRLYDEWEDEIGLSVDGMTPVISDNKFNYLKDEIFHLLKVEGALISVYDCSEKGLKSLQERYEAYKQLSSFATGRGAAEAIRRFWEERKQSWIDSGVGFDIDADDDFDMAQLDYDAIYQEVLNVCPSMENVIDYVRNIQAARLGEYDFFLQDIHTHSENEAAAFARLFDMSLRSAVKTALYYYKRYGIEYEDSFQEACIGIIMAIRKHNDNVEGLFPSYVSMWMRQIMSRDISMLDKNVRVPVHYRERIRQVLKQVRRVFDISDLDITSHKELYNVLLRYSDCGQDEAYRIAYILSSSESIEKIMNESEEEFDIAYENSDMDELIDSLSLGRVYEALGALSERERKIIVHRYGFDGYRESSLEEVGNIYGITRERVRQIEAKALKKIIMFLYRKRFITKEQRDDVIDADGKLKTKGYHKPHVSVSKKKERTSRRAPVNFIECGIPIGSELVYIEDNTVVVKVVSERKVEYNGEVTSLSAITKILKGRGTQGPAFFTYNGEKISDIATRKQVKDN